jgi:hypothetical protein
MKNYTKAIVDSDLDGVFCAVLLKHIYPKIQIIQADASLIIAGKYNHLVDAETIICDLPYVQGVGLYFDHHVSNKPKFDFAGSWADKDSAAEVVYDYYRDKSTFNNFHEHLEYMNKFDSGNINLDEFNNPNNLLILGFIIDRVDYAFNYLIIELLFHYGIDYVMSQELVVKKVNDYKISTKYIQEYASSNAQILDEVVIVDMFDYPRTDKISGYSLSACFPESKLVMAFKKNHLNKEYLKVRLYKGAFAKDNKYNALTIAKQLNPNAGGHNNACGFSTKDKNSKDLYISELKKILKNLQ